MKSTREKRVNPPTRSSARSPLVSIIIPHFNGVDILSDCLDSLDRSTYPRIEIIVVDNASTDGSPEWVQSNHPDVKLIRSSENHGYAGGCNRGAKAAAGEYLLFLNNDTVHESDWIEHLVETLQKDSSVGAVQPKILNYFDRTLFDYAGGSGGLMDIFCFPFTRGRMFLARERDRGQYDDKRQIFWASGTAFLTKSSLFEAAGGLDEVFFAHQEEIDLQWRMQLMGFRIFVNPRSLIYHKNALTLAVDSPKKKYLNHRNSLMMMLGNYNLPLTIYLFPIRLFLEFVAVVYAVALRDFKHVGAILKSLAWIVTHPATIYRKRRKTKALRKLRDREVLQLLYKGSVVLDYYILGKRRYSDLIPRHLR
ncbi:MAG: glycosyltransferase family 2 protein [Candidatus Neomarinimicrobiota bacterium]